MRLPQSRNMSGVRLIALSLLDRIDANVYTECIVYTWDYHSSISFWSGLRVQPILSDEVQTFKALITVHKVLQEGHPNVRVQPQLHRSSSQLVPSSYRPSKRLMVRLDGLRPALEPLLPTANEVGSLLRPAHGNNLTGR
jgi:hypothetical protein